MALAVASVMSVAHAQLLIGDDAVHKRLEITIDEDGSAHVLHELQSSLSPTTMRSVDGRYENLTMTDLAGNKMSHAVSQHENGFNVHILVSTTNTVIEYDLIDAVSKVGEYHTWDYSYPESTLFVMPDFVKRVYINESPIDFDDEKIKCHGCQALIEYAREELVKWESTTDGTDEIAHAIEIKTVADIPRIVLDYETRAIGLDIKTNGHAFVSVTIPHAFLDPPYEAHNIDRRLVARIESQNDTHSVLHTRMPESGVLSIFGNAMATPSDNGFLTVEADPLAHVWQVLPVMLVIAGMAGIVVVLFVWWRRRARS